MLIYKAEARQALRGTMVENTSHSLPVPASNVSPPFWGRAVLRAANDVAEGELVLRFANGAERTICAARDGVGGKGLGTKQSGSGKPYYKRPPLRLPN